MTLKRDGLNEERTGKGRIEDQFIETWSYWNVTVIICTGLFKTNAKI